MLSTLSNSDRQDILATVAQFPDSAEIHSPRHICQSWSGTREHLTELAKTSDTVEAVEAVITQLSTPRLFEDLELDEVDGILIENAGQPVVHLQTDRQRFETVTIDVDEVNKVTELVETVKARQTKRWLLLLIGGTLAYGVCKWMKKG